MKGPSPDFDVAVIGASLAGASAALALAAGGLSVALVDKAAFPRTKPCGEGLSLAGARMLERLGLGEALAGAPHSPIRGFRIWGDSAGPLELRWPEDGEPKALGIRRFHLDELLIARCRTAGGIRVIEGSAALAVGESEGICRVGLGGGEVSSRYALLACGGRSRLADRLAPRPASFRAARYGASLLAVRAGGTDPDCVTIARWGEAEIYCTPLRGKEINVAILGSPEAIRLASRAEGLERALARAAACLGTEIEPVSPLRGAGPFGWPARPAYRGRVLLCGDAVEALDPIGGMGMTHALASAAAASSRLIEALRSDNGGTRSLELYARERERLARPLRTFTALAHRLVRGSDRPVLRTLAKRRLASDLADCLQNGGKGSGLAGSISRALIGCIS